MCKCVLHVIFFSSQFDWYFVYFICFLLNVSKCFFFIYVIRKCMSSSAVESTYLLGYLLHFIDETLFLVTRSINENQSSHQCIFLSSRFLHIFLFVFFWYVNSGKNDDFVKFRFP